MTDTRPESSPDELSPKLAKILARIVSDNQKHRLEHSQSMADLMRQIAGDDDESETDRPSGPATDSERQG